ncbi:MAG: hypothetical protein ACNA7Y_05975 [Gammaproteobacteria bacterium]
MKKVIILPTIAVLIMTATAMASDRDLFPPQEFYCASEEPTSCEMKNIYIHYPQVWGPFTAGRYMFKGVHWTGIIDKGPVPYRYQNETDGNEVIVWTGFNIHADLENRNTRWEMRQSYYRCETNLPQLCPFTNVPFKYRKPE